MQAVQPETDFARTFQIEGLDVRGRLVRLGPALQQVVAGHDYPDAVSTIMGETVALAATLASALKFEGIFSLQTQSDGPVNAMVVDVTSAGAVRGYAHFDGDGVARLEMQGTEISVPHLLGSGHMAFTVDQGQHTDRYQGIAELDGATLSECAHHYFRNSEQLDTAIFLTADVGSAAALMVQRMPLSGHVGVSDEDEDGWRRAVALMASLTREELMDSTLDSDTLLYRLYHEDGVRVFEPQPLFHQCRCSRERVSTTLKSFPRHEITDEDGTAGVTCEFCKTVYHFDTAALTALYGDGDA